ncbi:MAG: hypothetical protein U0792_22770 [Gemmataceae bacterium]
MILEFWTDDGWQCNGTIGFDAVCRFLRRLRHPQPWRLRDGHRVWKIQPWNGRLLELSM